MKTALTTAEMAHCDKVTIERGTPSLELMLRVAKAVYASIELKGKVYIVCGKGNNGGDGLALAGVMLDCGITPRVFLISGASDDGRYYLDKLVAKGGKVEDISACDYDCDILVDCIFGTGFKGEPKQTYADIIKKINASKAYKVSVDIPSGLDGDSGKYAVCVKADETITVQYPKVGLYLNDGKDVSGKLTVIDVGIGLYAQGVNVVEQEDIAELFPKRKGNTHKGSYGKSAIVGGCSNYLGAVKLANAGLCALRSGGGLNTLVVPKSHVNNIAQAVWESTVFGVDDDEGYMLFNGAQIDKAIGGADCVAIGMGIGGRYDETLKILSHVLKTFDGKVLIDADGLNALAKDVNILKGAKSAVIITPHVKEMARLTLLEVEEILKDLIGVAKAFAKKYETTVLLKGASTVVTDGETVYLIVNGGAELSKGGSGDTLSGVILGLLSQGNGPIVSAYSAAYITAKVANKLREEFSEYGVMPSDVSREIARIIKEKKSI